MEQQTDVGPEADAVRAPVPVPLVERYFTDGKMDPVNAITWTTRDAWPEDSKYHVKDVLAPDFWSDNAVNITSKLYLSKAEGAREFSIGRLVHRVAFKITMEGVNASYFGTGDVVISGWPQDYKNPRAFLTGDALAFYDELTHILLNQLAVFNSPVLFNVGRPDRKQQVSACFILSVDDTTDSIMDTARREAFIFKGGSGSGFDISRLRGDMEPLSTGGTASGPTSFMRLWDAGAGTFKSGGMSRRAAKLVKCDVDHPNIRDFITCKVREERNIQMLLDAGVVLDFSETGERNLAEVTSFQNANNSVGVMDEFMRRAVYGVGTDGVTTEAGHREWPLIARKTGEVTFVDDAPDLLDLIASSAHACACPGMMFMDTINAMHTTPTIDGKPSPIRSSNPCGEFLHNDDTSCNLGSVNVAKFVRDGGSFDVEGFRHTVDVMALAMEICVELGHFPDEKLDHYSRSLRPLGLGYSNMGAAIMSQGLPYDSDGARDFAASVTALLTGRVYRKSAEIAKRLAPFHYFEENREAMLGVLTKHANALPGDGGGDIWSAAHMDWLEAMARGREHGFRNSQATVLPPAGTTSYFLDCDTTGIEPAFELVIHKQLAGGGTMTLVNGSVEAGAYALGICGTDNYEAISAGDLSCVPEEHRAVFATANEISAKGHIKMMAAVQPFVSGAISKTINMPAEATVDDVKAAYVLAWQLGCKDLAIYRNGSKARQPHSAKPKVESVLKETGGSVTLSIGDRSTELPYAASAEDLFRASSELGYEIKEGGGGPQGQPEQELPAQISPPPRDRLPRTRRSLTHKIHLRGQVGEYEGYIHAGMYPDGRLGEFFIEGFGKAGSFTLTSLGAMATAYSISIQYRIPFEIIARKFLNVSDETGGMVVPDSQAAGPPAIRSAKSIIDYVARWLVLEFGDADLHEEFGVRSQAARERVADRLDGSVVNVDVVHADPEAIARAVAWSLPWPSRRRQTAPDSASNGHAKVAEVGPPCTGCGASMRATGGCFTCPSCFATTGCG